MSPGYDPENLHDDACGIDWVLRFSGIVLNLKRPRPLTDLSCDCLRRLRMRSTSPPKSAWPGVSTMLMRVPDQTTEVTLSRIVMLEKPVDEGGLPMVDMGDDGDIAKLHGIRNVQRGPEGPAVHMTAI